uniref:ADP/ATP translocase n=1 Tax=Ditylenchus dipsaci TaxID=166011 RepID=A0A915E9E1_9BILA
MSGKFLCAPIERVKLTLQLQSEAAGHIKKPYKGILSSILRIQKTQGLTSLWRGCGTNLVRFLPHHTINMVFRDVYHQFQREFRKQTHYKPPFVIHAAYAAAASTIAISLVYPLELISTRLSLDHGTKADRLYNGAFDVAQTVVRVLIFSVMRVLLYDALVVNFGERDHRYKFAQTYILAQLALTTTQSVNYPWDSIRRRMMLSGGTAYKTNIDCFVHVMHHEGLKGVYAGFSANAARSIGTALFVALCEEIKRYKS